jgi:hypothetical protein
MTGWVLIDHRAPLEREPDEDSGFAYYPKEAVGSEAQLREALAHFRRLEPALIILVSPSKESLEIGLGPELSGLQWASAGDWRSNRVVRAVNPHPVTDQGMEIEDGGGGRGVEARHLLPTDEVTEAVIEFYRTGRLSDSLQWEKRWG